MRKKSGRFSMSIYLPREKMMTCQIDPDVANRLAVLAKQAGYKDNKVMQQIIMHKARGRGQLRTIEELGRLAAKRGISMKQLLTQAVVDLMDRWEAADRKPDLLSLI